MICYRKATLEDLNRVWDYQIAQNPDEARNLRWRNSFISRNSGTGQLPMLSFWTANRWVK